MRTSVTWRDREVSNPFARVLIGIVGVIVAIVLVIVTIVLVIVTIVVLAVFTPLAVVTHPLFLLCGCRGTVRRDGGALNIGFDREAFRRA